jgi:hypothetical protein
MLLKKFADHSDVCSEMVRVLEYLIIDLLQDEVFLS